MAAKGNSKYSRLEILMGTLIAMLLTAVFVLVGKMNGIDRPGPPRPGHGPKERDREIKNATGVVEGYDHNVHLDVNGLRLRTSSQGVLSFEFRPHTASAVTAAAKIHDSVTIGYEMDPNDEAIVYKLQNVKNLRTGSVIDVNDLPPPPRIPLGEKAQSFSIEKPDVITDGYGGIDALRSNGNLFHFKPEQVEDIQALIKNGRLFDLLAVHRGDDQGFINIYHDQVYIVISITIDDRTYIIK